MGKKPKNHVDIVNEKNLPILTRIKKEKTSR